MFTSRLSYGTLYHSHGVSSEGGGSASVYTARQKHQFCPTSGTMNLLLCPLLLLCLLHLTFCEPQGFFGGLRNFFGRIMQPRPPRGPRPQAPRPPVGGRPAGGGGGACSNSAPNHQFQVWPSAQCHREQVKNFPQCHLMCSPGPGLSCVLAPRLLLLHSRGGRGLLQG